ncbi:MAG: DUF2905 domain-containing protein [Proteobacteria bacterium]|nr:DUF2905 domain-containing protein [Pseudomonadota bacterium]
MGRWIITAGLILVVIGIILHFAPWLLNWFGKLPGDIRIETERSKIFIPIKSMAVLSIILTVLINFLNDRLTECL